MYRYFFSENNPRQCYECHSMTECNEKAKAKRCTSGEERCMKVMTEVAYKDSNLVYKTYSKGCATMDQCTNMKKNVFYSDCTDGDKCHMSCCEGDLCNAGSSFVVSASTLFACAVFTVFRLRQNKKRILDDVALLNIKTKPRFVQFKLVLYQTFRRSLPYIIPPYKHCF